MAKRGRPPGSKNKNKLSVVGGTDAPKKDQIPVGPGHNLPSDDEMQALTRDYRAERRMAIAAEKEARANRMNLDKKIKANLGAKGLADIKLMDQLDTPEGEEEFKQEIERQVKVARWMGMPIGSQGSLFDEDRRPIEERAFDEGKRAGMEGKSLSNPHAPGAPAHIPYNEGWRAGQDTLFAIKKPAAAPEAELIKGDDHQERSELDEFDRTDADEIGALSVADQMAAAGVTDDEPVVEDHVIGESSPWPEENPAGTIN